MRMMRNRLAGYTLIELVVVIVILGVLAVVAAPKFLSLGSASKAAVLENIGGAMESGLDLVRSRAAIDSQDKGVGQITIAGVTVPLFNGYPAVDGSDSFDQLNAQVKAWLEIDSVSLRAIQADNNAAPFFIDKNSRSNIIYIFYSEDLSLKSVNFNCHIRYSNPESGWEPVVIVEIEDC